LTIPNRRELELNELKWWSGWAKVKRLGRDAYVLTSSRFQEPFFNRASFLECSVVSDYIVRAEKLLRRPGLPPTVTVNQDCITARKKLAAVGYHTSEKMIVMVSAKHPKISASPNVEVLQTSLKTADEWARAYLLSFYGNEALLSSVTRITRHLVRNRSATLLEARLDGTVAGVIATFRTPGLAGIYCVGTVPQFRRKGVAGSLLRQASETAGAEGRLMTLQTLRSDHVEDFYKKRSFVELYQKCFMEKEN